MDCQEFLARYSDYDDSRLPPGEASRFEGHLSTCASCARYDRVLRKGRMVARQLRVEPTSDFMLRLDQRLWRESHGRTPPQRPGQAAGALAAVTVLLVAAAAVGLLGSRAAEPGSPEWRAARTASDRAAGSGPGTAVLTSAQLPPLGSAALRPWSERVAPTAGEPYSPLVVGPPAYRRAAGPSNPAHTLD